MRQFIRHPVDVPVEIDLQGGRSSPGLHAHDISLGGLALRSSQNLPPGTRIHLRIPFVVPPFEAQACVAWCHPDEEAGFDLGVTFLDPQDAFCARMVEQVCHIEDYRRSVQRTEGRVLDPEEAAAEWIARYAAQFPEIGHSRMH